jgi:hypothetical protein
MQLIIEVFIYWDVFTDYLVNIMNYAMAASIQATVATRRPLLTLNR